MRNRQSLAVNITLWFLLFAFLMGILMVFFVRRGVVEALRFAALHDQQAVVHTLAQMISTDATVLNELKQVWLSDQISWFVLDEDGTLVGYNLDSQDQADWEIIYPEISLDQILLNRTGTGLLNYDTERDLLIYEAIPNQDKILVSIVPMDEAITSLSHFETTAYLPIFTALILMTILGGTVTWITMRPLRLLADAVQLFGSSKFETRVETEDLEAEVEVLAINFNEMATQLQNLFDKLEDRVAERVRDLTLASQISREITTSLETKHLLEYVTQTIAETFQLYHVSIYLYSQDNATLTLSQGLHEIGEIMVAKAKEFQLQARGIVPLAARTQKAQVVNNVSIDLDHFYNELLPNTKSEMALPMLFHGELVGVLDLQAQEIDRFTADDLRIISTLAEQLAIAMVNARLFEKTQAALYEAERSNSVKMHFLATMSHELRTPLNAIINFTKFLLKGKMGPVTEQQIDALDKVKDSGVHLLNLINDVLDISKIEAGALHLLVERDIDIQDLLERLLANSKILLENKPVRVEVSCDPSLPKVVGDRQRIYQILLNIFSNACKFTEEGLIQIQISHTANDISIGIKDTGPGIAEEEHLAVFQTFKQTESGLKQARGTGLGMPISKKLAQAHGGDVVLESKIGEGAKFTFVMPIEPPNLEVNLI